MSTRQFSCTVVNGLVAAPSGLVEADIGIADGKIAALVAGGTLGAGERVIDAAGMLVLPAVIDMHVHFNDPGFPDREDFAHGTAAAAAGGVGTVVDMPLSGAPAVTSVESLELKKRAAAERAVVDYALWGGLVDDNVAELRAVRERGAIAFKAFTCFAGSDFPYARPDVLFRGLAEAGKHDLLVGVHCEDEALTSSLERAARSAGRDTAPRFACIRGAPLLTVGSSITVRHIDRPVPVPRAGAGPTRSRHGSVQDPGNSLDAPRRDRLLPQDLVSPLPVMLTTARAPALAGLRPRAVALHAVPVRAAVARRDAPVSAPSSSRDPLPRHS